MDADAIEIVVRPEPFYAVGQVYEQFADFPDEELLKLLERSNVNTQNRSISNGR